jgi:hypothetical protein
MSTKLYEVWFSRGGGLHLGPKFLRLADAQRFVKSHAREASYAVRAPDGHWEMIMARQEAMSNRDHRAAFR